MKKLVLLMLLSPFIGAGLAVAVYGMPKAVSQQPLITYKESCPIWICTPASDSRTAEQYAADCNPQPAYDPSTPSVIEYWCTTLNNPLDKKAQLPLGYVLVN